MPAGYSKRSLLDKLGIKSGQRLTILGAPAGYERTLGPLPKDVTLISGARGTLDFIQLCTVSRKQLARRMPVLKRALKPTGMLWISWPKGASGVTTDVGEDVVRELALSNGLVDVKVCAVDEVWSGLKLMYRRDDPARRAGG